MTIKTGFPRINADRLLADLETLRGFGATGTGVVRTTYSETDMASRNWLQDRMREAGLDTEIDGVGNVIGSSSRASRSLLIGSHTDTQPTGGWLDGALGVMYGLEVARTLAETGSLPDTGVDVASWADEEASYLGMVGSRSFCDLLEPGEIENAVGKDGRSLQQALADCGLEELPRKIVDPGRYIGYLEAHIEQGPWLERKDLQIGIVTSIVGMMDYKVTLKGQQNHAGTTPMELRKDAGMALIKLANELCSQVRKVAGDSTVWTIGNVEFEPGAPSIVPGSSEMMWQFRDPDQKRVENIREITEETVAEFNLTSPVQAQLELRDESAKAVEMSPQLRNVVAEAAEGVCPGKWIEMPSGAAHDAQVLATRMPSAMLFIPSKDGISHSFEEDSGEADIVRGCQVLADSVQLILEAENTLG